MVNPTQDDVAATAASSPLVGQVAGLVRWVGEGRKLTQTGALTLADARTLVDALGTGDEIDPKIGTRVHRTKSSTELINLSLVVAWAKAAGLVRVVKGRLAPVKKTAGLHSRPTELWSAMFASFGRVGPAFLPTGWFESFLRREFAAGADALLTALYAADGAVDLAELYEFGWAAATARYSLGHATQTQLDTNRRMNDRDVWFALATLTRLGAVTMTEEAAELTAAGRHEIRRLRGGPEPGEPVHLLRVTLLDVDGPAVWRRLLVPAATPLNRLHDVLQAALGWRNSHLHSFTDGQRTFGPPDPELSFTDERSVRLGDLDVERVLLYTYDFGDDWEHEIIVESVSGAEPGGRYPRCLDGGGACPPEDCGGAPGYEHLREVLADPGDAEHDELLSWLGLEHAAQFDPAAFDVDAANRRLLAVTVSR